MQQLQEIYQMKKKLKVLEEELLVTEMDEPTSVTSFSRKENKDVHDIIKNQVWSLSKQGIPVEQIAKQSSLSVTDVESILMEFAFKGKHD
ncbi:hypothetical protein R4Z10_15815 [Niallia sp. XMNu-256]|uniref:hypothetical protein n=1 Tax=Niallia sp. XMNu-256 TaxID=3082444 RepID=UPI0030D3DCB8